MKRLVMAALTMLALTGTVAAQDALAIIGAECMKGNQSACIIYQVSVQQQLQQAQQEQQAVGNVLNYLQGQQAIQQGQFRPQRPTLCWQQGYATVCQ